jgi:hypothetical protein
MRFMMMVKTLEGVPPKPELYAAMDKLIEEMTGAGILIEAAGLAPSASGARVRAAGAKVTVTDGPFTEAKEVIGGFGILELPSRADAIDHGRRFMQLHVDVLGPSFEGECEIRQIEDPPPANS